MLTPQPYMKSESPQSDAYLAQQFFRPMGSYYVPQLFSEPNPFESVGYSDPNQLHARIQRISPHLFVPPPLTTETPVPLNQSNIQLQ